MTRIRATCPSCGEVELRPTDVSLVVLRTEVEEVAEGSAYRFVCPACSVTITKPADERIARLLEQGGVSVTIHEGYHDLAEAPAPARFAHPEHPAPGPVLTLDDLLDLHLVLQRDDWFDQLLAMSS